MLAYIRRTFAYSRDNFGRDHLFFGFNCYIYLPNKRIIILFCLFIALCMYISLCVHTVDVVAFFFSKFYDVNSI